MESIFLTLLDSPLGPTLKWGFSNLLQTGISKIVYNIHPPRTHSSTHRLHHGWQQTICQSKTSWDCRRTQSRRTQAPRGNPPKNLKFTFQMLTLCQELGITTVTAFAFSIDNFKRSKDEVRSSAFVFLTSYPGRWTDESGCAKTY